MDLATAGPADFEQLVGTSFRAGIPGGEVVDVTLIAVERGPGGTDSRPFRVLFRGSTTRLPQGIVSLTRDGAEPMDLFLVPAIPDAEGPLYVAVFG
jgi:uncharacterized protein DUF6916